MAPQHIGPMVYGLLRSAVYRENGVRVSVGSPKLVAWSMKCLAVETAMPLRGVIKGYRVDSASEVSGPGCYDLSGSFMGRAKA